MESRSENTDTDFRIIEGDSLQKLDTELEPSSIDCCFISPDPPMNDLEIWNLVDVLSKVWRVLKHTGSLFVHISDFHNPYTGSLMRLPERFTFHMTTSQFPWILRSDIIWHRPISVDEALHTREENDRFLRDYDHIHFFTKRKWDYYFDRTSLDALTSVFSMPLIPITDDEFGTGFPPSLIQGLLDIVCPKSGSTILDCYCGCGTTGIAALRLGHKFIGIEKDGRKIARITARLVDNFTSYRVSRT